VPAPCAARQLRFQLAIPAHVIVLRMTENGIEQVQPLDAADPPVPTGLHAARPDDELGRLLRRVHRVHFR